MYDDANPEVTKSTQYAPHRTPMQWKHDRSKNRAIKKRQKEEPGYVPEQDHSEDVEQAAVVEEDDEPEQPQMGVNVTIGLLVIITVVRSHVDRVIGVNTP